MMRAGAISVVLLWSALAIAEDPPQATEGKDAALVELAVPHDGDPFSIDEKDRVTVSVMHAFARPEAAARLSYLLAYWKKRFNVTSEWKGDRVFISGNVYGIKIQALFAISQSSVVGFAHDPGWPWRGRVQSYVDSKLKKYFNLNYDEP